MTDYRLQIYGFSVYWTKDNAFFIGVFYKIACTDY